MRQKENAVRQPIALPAEQHHTSTVNIISQKISGVNWLSDENVVNEPLFFKDYFYKYGELHNINGDFYNINGFVSRTAICKQVQEMLIAGGVTTTTARRANNLVNALQIYSYEPPFVPCADEIHVSNGLIQITDDWVNAPLGTPPPFKTEKKFALNRLNVKYDPLVWTRGFGMYPRHFFNFLDDLVDPDDAVTLQEYLGYLLIPTTKAQTALFLIGNGGEGKSQIGAVLGSIFGGAMYGGSVHALDEDKFFLANLAGKSFLLDDDAELRAFSSTGNLKKLITATPQVPFAVQKKGEQGYQTPLFARVLAFANGAPKALYDKSDGFSRRLLIVTTRPKPANRLDNPNLAAIFEQEKLQILVWLLQGLHRLLKNNFKFTISAKTRNNIAAAARENNNVLDFIDEETVFNAELSITSVALYSGYAEWCERNGLIALSQNSFIRQMNDCREKLGIASSNHIDDNNGHCVRGFIGLALKR